MSKITAFVASLLVVGIATSAVAAKKNQIHRSAPWLTTSSGGYAASPEEEARFDHPKGFVQGY
jgi:hypothetical protein